MASETIDARPGQSSEELVARSARKLLLSVARRVDGKHPGAHLLTMAAIDAVDDLIAEVAR